MIVRRSALAFGLVSMVWACTVFNPLDDYGPGKGAAADGGKADATPSSSDAADGCNHASPPALPPTEDGALGLRVVFALDALYIGTSPDAGSLDTSGYDLDGVCTCPGPGSCSPPMPKSGAPKDKCDAPGGIDNSGAQLMQTIIQSAGSDGDANDAIARGTRGLLIQLVGYNGGQNDRDLQVTFFATAGTERDGDNNPIMPRHDGSDAWTVRRDSLFGGTGDGPNYIGAYRDDHAYVSNGVLVAHVDFPLAFGSLDANLTGTVVTANLVKAGAGYRLNNGRFVGRWPTKDLLTALDSLPDPTNSAVGLCGNTPVYQQLKSNICAAVDLRANSADDNQNKPCDALGMLISFTAESALLGTAVDKPPTAHLCGDGYSDDCTK